MVELVNFRNTLRRIGFNDVTSQEIIDNGFDSISSLFLVTENAITDLFKHIGRWTENPNPTVVRSSGNVVNIPFLSLWKLVAMRKWALVQTEKGIHPEDTYCTSEEIVRMIEQIKKVRGRLPRT